MSEPAQQPLDDAALRLQEVAFGLRIRDVMTLKVFAVSPSCTMRDVQIIMKNNAISGVPVVDERHVVGLVSVHDIMNAFENDWMQNPVSQHMARDVQTLSEEMPLAYAMSAFSKFPYRRFPVVDRKNELVGMLTPRNINLALIHQLTRKLEVMEGSESGVEHHTDNRIFSRVYRLARYDFDRGGQATGELKKQLEARGIPPALIRRAAVASYELEINVIAHSHGGTLNFYIDDRHVRITANDFGPGIADVDQAMQEGYSTANDWIRSQGFGAGMGLANIQRVSDDFVIQSGVDMGTMAKAVIHLNSKEVGS